MDDFEEILSATERDDVHTVAHLTDRQSHYTRFYDPITVHACRHGSVNVLKLIYTRQSGPLYFCGYDAVREAVRHDRLAVVEYIHGKEGARYLYGDRNDVLCIAAGRGNLDMVQFIVLKAHVRVMLEDSIEPLRVAVRCGRERVLAFMMEQYDVILKLCKIYRELACLALEHGHTAVLKLLHDTADQTVVGNIEPIAFDFAHVELNAGEKAAFAGHAEALLYVMQRNNGNADIASRRHSIVHAAAFNNHVALLRAIANEDGVNWTDGLYAGVVRGHMDVLRLVFHGPNVRAEEKLAAELLRWAIFAGRVPVLEFLLGVPGVCVTEETEQYAAETGSAEIVQCLSKRRK